MAKERRYMIPFQYEHLPGYYDVITLHEKDLKKVKRLYSCVFTAQTPTICYEDVEID